MTNLFAMMLLPILFIISVNSANSTERYFNWDSFQSRQNRLITFNTQEKGDITMEINFSVPFITIPVKKSLEMASGFAANINIGALILTGAIALGFFVVIPGVVLLMTKKLPTALNGVGGGHGGYRSDETNQFEAFYGNILTSLDDFLARGDVDSKACFQKFICQTVKASLEKLHKGIGSSSDEVIEGLAKNKWSKKLLNGTIFQEALQNGISDSSCSKYNYYTKCILDELTITSIQNKSSELLEYLAGIRFN